MSVDINIEDLTLDRTLFSCRNAYVDTLLSVLRPHLGADQIRLAFNITQSSYLPFEDEITDLDELPRAADIAHEFDLLLKAMRALGPSEIDRLDKYQKHAMKVFSPGLFEDLRDHCREHPDSRILVSLC